MPCRVAVLPRLLSVCLFDSLTQVNYPASLQVFKCGDVGIIFSLHGAGFYDIITGITEHDCTALEQMMSSLDVTRLQGYIVPGHLALMRRRIRKLAVVEPLFEGVLDGHPMVWVDVRLQSAVAHSDPPHDEQSQERLGS